MTVKKVNVSKSLIKNYLPHPEFYGEVIVELENGMTTDVYTDDDLSLFTMSNQQDLVNYLNNHASEPILFELSNQRLKLKTIESTDLPVLFTWMNKNKASNLKYSETDVKKYISQAISMNAHLFMIENEGFQIGLIGYDVIEFSAILNLAIYENDKIDVPGLDQALDLIIQHIHHEHTIYDILFRMNSIKKDWIELFKHKGFNELKQDNHRLDNQTTLRLNTHVLPLSQVERDLLMKFFQLRPEKLYYISAFDDLIDLDHAIDYALKTYIGLIFSNQLHLRDAYESIYVDEDGFLTVEDNLLEKYDTIMATLFGDDYEVAKAYRFLIKPVIDIINSMIKIIK